MPAQYDVYRLDGGALVLVLQNDLLDQLATRVVAPMIPADRVQRVMRTLNPEFRLGAARYLLMPQLAATVSVGEFREHVGSLSMMRDEITRAVDALLAGI